MGVAEHEQDARAIVLISQGRRRLSPALTRFRERVSVTLMPSTNRALIVRSI